jgi:CO dehydrogenase maturation factor
LKVRVAFVGKGGAGKSVIAGTLARLLAARGERVLAVDSDPLPGLAFSVGVKRSDAGIPEEAIVARPEGEVEGPPYRLRDGLTALEAVERYAAPGPDGIRFLQFGKTRGSLRPLFASQFAFRQILAGLPAEGWHVVGDLPGGTRQPFMGWGQYARTLLIVVEPTAASLLSARRLAKLARAAEAPRLLAVASKVHSERDRADIERRCGLRVLAAVPEDRAVRAAERLGLPPVDHDPSSPAVTAVASLLELLVEQGAEA